MGVGNKLLNLMATDPELWLTWVSSSWPDGLSDAPSRACTAQPCLPSTSPLVDFLVVSMGHEAVQRRPSGLGPFPGSIMYALTPASYVSPVCTACPGPLPCHFGT